MEKIDCHSVAKRSQINMWYVPLPSPSQSPSQNVSQSAAEERSHHGRASYNSFGHRHIQIGAASQPIRGFDCERMT